MPAAIRYDLRRRNEAQIQQGSDYTFIATLYDDEEMITPLDLTGYTARMQVRASHVSETVVLERTTEGIPGDNIVLGGTEGTVTITISATVSATLPAPFTGVYDIELVDPAGEVDRFLEGYVEVTPEVTR